jgi:hypothetical protein
MSVNYMINLLFSLSILQIPVVGIKISYISAIAC